jgi:hypothetical protein
VRSAACAAFEQMLERIVVATRLARQHLVDHDVGIDVVAGQDARVGRDFGRVAVALRRVDVQCAGVLAVDVQMRMRILDHQHGVARAQDCVEIDGAQMFEFTTMPFHDAVLA